MMADRELPQYGARVEVHSVEVFQVALSGGSAVGEVKRVKVRDGGYLFGVKLGGASGKLVWCSADQLEVVGQARATDPEAYR